VLALQNLPCNAEQVRERLAQQVTAADDGDHYALLGVDRAADDDDLHAAYRARMASLVNMLALLPRGVEDLETLVEQQTTVRAAVENAFGILMDPDARGIYDAERRLARDPVPAADSSKPAAVVPLAGVDMHGVGGSAVVGGTVAKVLDMRGRQYMAREQYDRAEKVLKRAFEIEPSNADYQLNYGWAVLNNPAFERDSARLDVVRTNLESACAGLPWNSVARYRMSQYWRAVGATTQYRRELEAALRSDEEHFAASKELAALQRHERMAVATRDSEPDEVRPGVFASIGRLFRS
jgi:curved DNA-binding protein CbpA